LFAHQYLHRALARIAGRGLLSRFYRTAGTRKIAITTEGYAMPNISLKNIPNELYVRLKAAAQAHHRSLSGEILHCVEYALGDSPRPDMQTHLATARRLRAKTAAILLTDSELQQAKQAGRP
jgi:plasmid stability protein